MNHIDSSSNSHRPLILDLVPPLHLFSLNDYSYHSYFSQQMSLWVFT